MLASWGRRGVGALYRWFSLGMYFKSIINNEKNFKPRPQNRILVTSTLALFIWEFPAPPPRPDARVRKLSFLVPGPLPASPLLVPASARRLVGHHLLIFQFILEQWLDLVRTLENLIKLSLFSALFETFIGSRSAEPSNMDRNWKSFFLLSIAFFDLLAVSAVDRLPTADKTRYDTYLQKFATYRNHYRPDARENLENATLYVKEKFESAGLKVNLQNFTTSDTTTGQSVSGTNVIGILEGQFFNTANDEVIILGAHLDTRGILHEGVNNDGSGLAALISLAEDLTGKDKCVQNHSILFVAFDRSETFDVQRGNAVCNKSCGSTAFVSNINTVIPHGSVKIAIIMDCISNFNLDPESQKIYEQPIKDYFSNFVLDQGDLYFNKGNYLAAVGREDEKEILTKYVDLFREVKKTTYDQYQAVDFMWNFKGKPTGINLTNVETAFEKSDTLSFWDANIKSILLTDTCYQRDPLFGCKSSFNCDNYRKAASDDNLGFMYTTVTAAKNLTKFLVCSDTDINECTQGTAKCAKNATCTNTFGSYKCSCNNGYHGNGFTCDDIDECAQGDAKCSKEAYCVNLPGSYSCNCKKGFSGDGFNCVASGTTTVAAIFYHVTMLVAVGLLEFTM